MYCETTRTIGVSISDTMCCILENFVLSPKGTRLDVVPGTYIQRHLFGRSIFGQLHLETAASGYGIGGKSDVPFTREKHANVITAKK